AIGHEKAHTLTAAKHFADNDTNQPQGYTLTDAGQDERDGPWKSDRLEDLPVRSTERASGPKQIRCERANTGNGMHQNREERRHEDDKDFGFPVDAKPDDD